MVIEPLLFDYAQIGVHLDLRSIFGPFACWIHQNLSGRVLVDTKADGFVLEVIDLVQMSEKGITDEQ